VGDKIKWAVIGSGGIACRRTIPEGIIAACNAELVDVYDVDEKVNKQVAHQFGAVNCSSIDQLLSGIAEAVYIASPAYLHFEHVMACAKAKKHVLCEKPLGMDPDQTKQMVEQCAKANIKLGTAFMMRFHSQHQQALQMVKENKLGKLVFARAQLSCWYPPIEGAWRQDPAKGSGGSLMDMGGHCIDLLEMLLGKVEKVSCVINNLVQDYETEDSAVATLYFENGAIGIVDNFFCIPDAASKNRLELYGSKGSIIAEGTIGQSSKGEMTAYLEEDSGDYNAQQARSQNSGISIDPQPVNTYQAEIEEFSLAILDNTQSLIDAQVGVRSQQILQACYESALRNEVIDVE
jgi:predicted dehydrogenase